eukprot:scaffold3183_cov381-Prasinococcus_capsulatus_cf.AAC.3
MLLPRAEKSGRRSSAYQYRSSAVAQSCARGTVGVGRTRDGTTLSIITRIRLFLANLVLKLVALLPEPARQATKGTRGNGGAARPAGLPPAGTGPSGRDMPAGLAGMSRPRGMRATHMCVGPRGGRADT